MHQPFNDKLGALLASRRPFAIATVVRVRGSASARPGSKALVDEHGRNVFGWVGGGCAESLVREEALAALEDGARASSPRTWTTRCWAWACPAAA